MGYGSGQTERRTIQRHFALYVGLFASIWLLGLACNQAYADNTFGTRAWNGLEYGGGVSIKTPSLSQHINQSEFVLHRAVAQSEYGSTPGLIQAGVYRSGQHLSLDTCGPSAGRYTKYLERKRRGTPNTISSYKCQLFAVAGPGTTHRYDVFSVAGDTNHWKVEINNNLRGKFFVDFNRAYPAIGGEIAGSSPQQTDTNALYGPTKPWIRFQSDGQNDPEEVTNNSYTSRYVPRPGWSVGAAPTPLRVTH